MLSVQTRHQTITGLLGRVLMLLLAMSLSPLALASALSDYVFEPDAAYKFKQASTSSTSTYKVYNLEMVSQQWPAQGNPDRRAWTHGLMLIVPKNVASQTALLVISGGMNSGNLNPTGDELTALSLVATSSKSVVAYLGQIPNQPLVFTGDNGSYEEDLLVARSWDQHMRTGDPRLNVYLPMVKASVRALDAVQSHAKSAAGLTIKDFVVAGFSKRGAITYLTAAVDPRVRAFAPGVFDALNFAKQVEHHFEAYGFYAPAVAPYLQYDIVRRVRTPEGRALLAVIDPYSYRSLLNKPKFIILSSGDQFFLPDGLQFYLNDLPGETRVRFVPNSDHSTANAGGPYDSLTGLIGWFTSVSQNKPRPTPITWTRMPDGGLQVRAPGATLVRLWKATNPTTRDFRRELIGEAWALTPVYAGLFDGLYKVGLPAPATGWSGYYMEAVYATSSGVQTYSTPIFVTPETLPFKVVDPLRDPKPMDFWTQRVDSRTAGDPLLGYFALPVLGQYVKTADAAAAQFHAAGANAMALKECLATRLNVASGEMGWYTAVPTAASPNRVVWEDWLEASDSYKSGNVARAAELCRSLNAR